jgi:hypothetical protein
MEQKFGRPGCRKENNIKMNNTETVSHDVD